jgi:peptidase M1-like protein
VSHLTLERDAFEFQFQNGVFHFLPEISGRRVGAVFVGEGQWKLTPASEAEKRQIALQTGDASLPALSDRFETLVLLFTDDTAAQISRQGSAGTPAARAGSAFDAFLHAERKTLQSNLHLRLLRDLLEHRDPKDGAFFAFPAGGRLPAGLLAVDPSGLEWFATHHLLGGEGTAFFVAAGQDTGFWYLSPRRGEGEESGPAHRAHATHYTVETTVDHTLIRGTTVIDFLPEAANLRVLSLRLDGRLRIEEAVRLMDSGPGPPLAVIQEAAEEDGDAAVVFPEPLPSGAPVRVRITYGGKDILHDAGEGNFVVGARESWYPNLGVFSDLAAFDLTYRVPKGNTVVSVGQPVADRLEGNTRVSVWKAEGPIRVAGFNYGLFKTLEQKEGGGALSVTVYTNPGTPDVIKEINDALARRSQVPSEIGSSLPADLDNPMARPSAPAGLHGIHVNADDVAQSAMADAINTVRVCNAYFGPIPQKRLSITEQSQWNFGQSWPSLVFLPYLAFLDASVRQELGLRQANAFVEQVGLHEVAHQWWGHHVGWASYRDEWLSEGLAEFSAALVLQQTGGPRKYSDFWEQARRWILARPPGSAVANDAAGPISQGFRLATRRSPAAYAAMIYSKGAFVVHMLRMLMRQPRSQNPDADFIALMTDFSSTYAGKNPSTRDFQRVVEKHMIPAMNATSDGKMDWFFRQWVYGTEIPRLREKSEIHPEADGRYRITGSLSQEGVSPDFRTLVHLYVELDKGSLAHLGIVPIVGSTTQPLNALVSLPKKPRRLVLNAMHEVLTRD